MDQRPAEIFESTAVPDRRYLSRRKRAQRPSPYRPGDAEARRHRGRSQLMAQDTGRTCASRQAPGAAPRAAIFSRRGRHLG